MVELDCCIDVDGFVSDQAVSIEIGNVSKEVHDLNTVTIECLYKGINAIKAGERLLQIARAVETHAKKHSYGIVKEWGGHGVGFSVHEDPHIPNYPHGPNPKITNGMVFALEPMITLGIGDVELLEDNWTVVTTDGKISSHWEHTVVIINNKVEILTDPLEAYLVKNKESPERAPGYLRFLLEIFAYVGEQIPHTPSVPQQALNLTHRFR